MGGGRGGGGRRGHDHLAGGESGLRAVPQGLMEEEEGEWVKWILFLVLGLSQGRISGQQRLCVCVCVRVGFRV
jgi:hypothetical protein